MPKIPVAFFSLLLAVGCTHYPSRVARARPEALTCARSALEALGYRVEGSSNQHGPLRAVRTRASTFRNDLISYRQDLIEARLRVAAADTQIVVTMSGGSTTRTLDPHVSPEMSFGAGPPTSEALANGDSLIKRCGG